MANTYKTLNDLFTAIADAIRAKKHSSGPIVADNFPAEIESIETGGGNSPEADLALTLWEERSKATVMASMFQNCASLTTVPLFDTSSVTTVNSMFSGCTSLTTVPLFDTSNVTTMSNMFYSCTSLTTVPLFDTSNVVYIGGMFQNCTSLTTVPLFDTRKVTSISNMFYNCASLTTVPLFDTSSVTSMGGMFVNCTSLTTVPLFDTSSVTGMSSMFQNCTSLTTVPLFDTRKVTSMGGMFVNCRKLTDCYLRNIKTNLQVGYGTSYGHLLTLDSLIHLIKELRDTGTSKTLTVGSANLEKLVNVYVRTIDITDEMRAEDDLIDEKLPFEVCESTDEGATLITNYVSAKHWNLA